MISTGRFTRDLRRLVHASYDHCCRCRSALPKGVAAYAGFDADGSPLYVGECCRSDVSELASHVYWWWETYPRPAPQAKLWRYMDFAKFVSLLMDRALYFPRLDQLGDPFEGARGYASRETRFREFYVEFFRNAVRNPPPGGVAPDPSKVEAEAQRLYAEMQGAFRRDLTCTFVSCWHQNDVESEALWRLYCPPGSTGVAIQTTAERLDSALGPDHEARLGCVQYIDYKTGFAGTYDRVFWKRKSLSHEAEVRAVLVDHASDGSPGLQQDVDLAGLLERVVISPFAPPWFHKLVERTLATFDVTSHIAASELSEMPFF